MKKPPIKIIKESLINNYGILVNTALEIGCSRSQLRKWVDSSPDLLQTIVDSKESLKDVVEGQLLKNIKEGKETSLIWYMKTQMRDRNYKETTDPLIQYNNQLNISVQNDEAKQLMNDVIKKISNE